MYNRILLRACMLVGLSGLCPVAAAVGQQGWQFPGRRLRSMVTRATPWRDDTAQPVEVVIDFPLLLEQSGVAGQFDSNSLRIGERSDDRSRREVPFGYRPEYEVRSGCHQNYLSWNARPTTAGIGAYEIYFDTKERRGEPPAYEASLLPPENLLANPGFEDQADGLPGDWAVTPEQLVPTSP